MGKLTYSRINKNDRLIEFTYSECDREFINKFWNSFWIHKSGYIYITIDRKNYQLHRLLTKAMENEVVDHVDGNPLNNETSNTRKCTRQQNQMNMKTRTTNKAGQAGVGWCNRRNKWRSRISCNKVEKHLGYFENLEDAIRVRKAAEIEYFGEFRRK